MRSTITLTLAVLLLTATFAVQNAHAQLEFTLGGGVNVPQGDYSDQANTGYAFTTGLGYRFLPYAAAGVEMTYNGNKAPDAFTESLGPGYEMKTSILQYSAMARLVLPVGNHNVFAKGSVGNYRGSASVKGPLGEASISNTKVGYGLGAGLLINSTRNSAFFADVTHHHVKYDDEPGGTVTFWTLTVGAMLKFDLFQQQSETEQKAREDVDKLN